MSLPMLTSMPTTQVSFVACGYPVDMGFPPSPARTPGFQVPLESSRTRSSSERPTRAWRPRSLTASSTQAGSVYHAGPCEKRIDKAGVWPGAC